MDPDQKLVLGILNKFQWHYHKYDICRLRFDQLFSFLKIEEQEVLLSICELDKAHLDELDALIPPANILINPYRYNLFARRFVRVTPDLWLAFSKMATDLRKATDQSIEIISGYRSPAYQSMIFVKKLYTHNNDTNLAKKWANLPGRSEHENYKKLAIDISDGGTKELSEISYEWLVIEAGSYGFTNSYPKTIKKVDISFEPWHWCFDQG